MVADHYHVLPSAAARELDEDPELLALKCRSMSKYASAHAAFHAVREGDAEEVLGKSEMLSRVIDNAFALRRERLARRTEG